MDIERLSVEDYAPRDSIPYVDRGNLFDLYDKLAFHADLICIGPKGLGKSLSVAAYAAKQKCPIITFDCSEDVRRAQLLGMFVLREGRTPFVLGPVTSAIEIANDSGECILMLEELNSLAPNCQKILNGLTDWRRSVEVPEAKKVFRLSENAKLWVVGTMNNSGYGGTFQLNEDLKSRFRMLSFDYPEGREEEAILLRTCNEQTVKKYLKQVLTLATETRQGVTDYALSTRDLTQLIQDIEMLGIDQALRLLAGKYEGAAQVHIRKRIASIFGLAKK